MTEPESRILPEGLLVSSIVSEIEFTDVTDDGEVYTLYRIVRFTHEFIEHPQGWTHLANVFRIRTPALGVAHLLVSNKMIERSKVTIAPDHT